MAGLIQARLHKIGIATSACAEGYVDSSIVLVDMACTCTLKQTNKQQEKCLSHGLHMHFSLVLRLTLVRLVGIRRKQIRPRVDRRDQNIL